MSWYDSFIEYACAQVDDRILEALNARGVSDTQVRQFRIGYVDKDLPPECPPAFRKWSHDGSKLIDTYVFPLTNILNEIHGLQFRHVDREKSGYMDYLDSRGEAVLFGLGPAAPYIWSSSSISLVEGNFDLFPIQRHDPTVVATLTARVVDPLVWWIRRVCKRVVLGYDADATGRRGVAQFQKLHHSDFEEIVDLNFPQLPMPNGKKTKDPNELWEVWGDVQFGKFLQQRTKTFSQMEW